MKQAELSDRIWAFAARVGNLVDEVPNTRLGRHVAGQLVRSGTSSAPNYDESGGAESRGDFIHKLSIALKELRETRGWLRFLVSAELLPASRMADLIDECEQLCRILGKSLQTLRGAEELKSKIPDSRFKIPNLRPPTSTTSLGFDGLDHLAIVVPSTEEALKIWRDRLGFPVVCSEVVNGGVVRLTHLDLGNTHLQLVEPLSPDHPLRDWLAQHGPGLHHCCFKVGDVGASHAELTAAGLAPATPPPHQGTQGKRALFLDKSATQGVPLEITGP
jgi:methylmalonyl-CoA/ethylmalonyl-CoA epimerase